MMLVEKIVQVHKRDGVANVTRKTHVLTEDEIVAIEKIIIFAVGKGWI